MSTTDTCPTDSRTSDRTPAEAATRPAYHVQENAEEILLEVALPGVRKDDLSITAEGQTLVVTADRGDSVPESWKTHRAVSRPGRYELRVRLHPRFDPQRTAATLENGVLALRVEAREEARPRKIEIH